MGLPSLDLGNVGRGINEVDGLGFPVEAMQVQNGTFWDGAVDMWIAFLGMGRGFESQVFRDRRRKDFQDQKLRIRKELREVRHRMDSDIERLGMVLKVVNIVVAPVLLTLALFGWHRLRVRRAQSRDARGLA